MQNPVHTIFQQPQAIEVLPPPIVYSADELAAQLQHVKDNMWDKIKVERDNRSEGGVLVQSMWFHSDQESVTKWLGLVMLGANVPAIQWKTMDGTFVTLSQGLVQQVFGAIVSLTASSFAVAEAHRAAMLSSNDPANYDFSTNWPQVFGG